MSMNFSVMIKTVKNQFEERKFQKALKSLQVFEGSETLERVSSGEILQFYLLLGEAYWYTGHLLKAKKAFDRGLSRIGKFSKDDLTAEILNDSALVDKNLGYYESALSKYEQAHKLYEALDEKQSRRYVHLLNNLAILLKDMGRLTESEDYFKQALSIITDNNDFPKIFLMRIQNNYASLLTEKGDMENAKKHYFQSMRARVRQFGFLSPAYAESLNNLAVFYESVDNRISVRILEKSAAICKKLFPMDDLRTAKTKKNLAVALIKEKDYQTAERILGEVLPIIEIKSSLEHPLYWKTMNSLAQVEWKMGNLEAAKALFEKIDGFYKEKNNLYPIQQMEFLFDYSRFLFYIELTDQAFSILKNAAMMQNDFYEKLVKGLPEDSAILLIQKMSAQTGLIISSLLRLGRSRLYFDFYPLLYFRKGMVFEVTYLHRMATVSSKDEVLRRKFEDYSKARKEIARRLFTGASENEDAMTFRNRQQALIEKCVELERDLLKAMKDDERGQDDKDQQLKLLSENIGENDLILDYYKYPKYDFDSGEYTCGEQYSVFVLNKGEKGFMINPVLISDAQNVEEIIGHYRKIISGSDETRGMGHSRLAGINEIINVCKQLYKTLLTPGLSIKQVVPENGLCNCYICPDGEISTISFESLISPQDDFFLDGFCVNYLNNIREFSRNQNEIRLLADIVIFANPEYDLFHVESPVHSSKGYETRESVLLNILREKTLKDGYYDQLEGTGKEGRVLQELFKEKRVKISAVHAGKDAYERNLKLVDSPAVLHLATHGFFISDRNKAIPHPMFRSGIVLSGVNSILKGKSIPDEYEDGIFSAYDATTLSLENTQIVVLSACETGLGEIQAGEGVLGLRRSFAQAGAKTLVMSLWRVSDQYTVFMMESFYKNLLKGLSVPAALREAQLALIEFLDDTFGFASPSLWAGFICQGDPHPFLA